MSATQSEKGQREIEDGFGSTWVLCERDDRPCGLEVVRPGKTQCWCDHEDAEGNCIHSRQTWNSEGHKCDSCSAEVPFVDEED